MFKKAERRVVKLKMALTGPSGSGKTYSALELATGLGGKIAVVDTENGSASLYSDRFGFDTLEIEAPYTIPKYTAAILAAKQAGYDILVIDSITHAWAGEGGLLSKKEAMDARGGNSYTNWGSITKEQESFKAALLGADIHLIVTMRSKQDYVVEVNDKGKSAPRKVGLAPIQRDGMEYEFTTVFDIAMDHNAAVSKDRTGLFDGKIFKITRTTGKEVMAWLNAGKPQTTEPLPPEVPQTTVPNSTASGSGLIKPLTGPPLPAGSVQMVSEAQLKRLFTIRSKTDWSVDDVKHLIKSKYGKDSTKALNRQEYDWIIQTIESTPPAASTQVFDEAPMDYESPLRAKGNP